MSGGVGGGRRPGRARRGGSTGRPADAPGAPAGGPTGSRGRADAQWQAFAPGRVNLIGEHTDYNGLPVFPIAIDRGVRIAFSVTDEPVVRLDSPVARFDPFAFQLKRPIEAAGQGDWSNYVRAPARGLMEHGVRLRRGIVGTVTGDVAIAAGLSSSSALVVASALALLKANGVPVQSAEPATAAPDGSARSKATGGRRSLARLELAALMARAERFVGLEGGGMDQAACLHGRVGHALRIEFEPLRVTPVAVPEGWRWVVASSLVRAEKSGGAREAYNERARQCREALGVVGGKGGGAAVSAYRDLVAEDDLDGLLRRARRALGPVLFRRFRHVVTEGRRVAQAEVAMRDGDMGRFGDLMVRSHESLRDDYEVSTDELDAIVEAALGAGAAGARLTGAGFGGCAVVLCDDRSVAPVMAALAARFYAPYLGRPPTGEEMFAVRAGGGAGIQAAKQPAGGARGPYPAPASSGCT